MSINGSSGSCHPRRDAELIPICNRLSTDLYVVRKMKSRFCIDHVDGRVRVWRCPREHLADPCVRESNRWGGAHVMMLGGIAFGIRTVPVFLNFNGGGGLTAYRYINQVLRPLVVPFLRGRPGTQFQQDNARPYSARLTQTFLQRNNSCLIT